MVKAENIPSPLPLLRAFDCLLPFSPRPQAEYETVPAPHYPDRHHEDRALLLRLASTPLDGIAENSIGGAHPVVCNVATRYRGRVCIHYLGSLKALGKQVVSRVQGTRLPSPNPPE
ncbi:hypothetical protein FGLOB1_12957 [Fusarium globosum]|uniref:Uncharacterized protein n=1 Tax=Fusarium globosum TaxID=78864 RepID=A0A8H5XNW7_9HYPO|nr:hypothetical protein FGLOB1_12957 [Fusarium globosum]